MLITEKIWHISQVVIEAHVYEHSREERLESIVIVSKNRKDEESKCELVILVSFALNILPFL
jgi:hypothetical protein